MNIVNKLTLRQMMKNKRRTLVTMIGVIISVAMVSAVAIIATSFMDVLQRESIESNGNWHVQYNDVNEEQMKDLRADEQTETSFLSRDVGYADLPGSENKEKPYLFLKQFDDKGFELYPIKLTEGRLPENDQEIILTKQIETNAKVSYELGDELTLDLGERVVPEEIFNEWGMKEDSVIDQSYSLMRGEEGDVEEEIDVYSTKTFTVVGFMERPHWENSWAPGYTVISYLDASTVSKVNPADLSIVMKKVNRGIYDYSKGLAKEFHIDSYETNSDLLRYHGVIYNDGMFISLFIFVTIIMSIIMIGSVSLIYNAFAISVSERSRHLGMLSSVGATKRQKRNSVLFEGAVIGLISIPLGFLSGVLGLAVTFHLINDSLTNALDISDGLRVVVTPFTVILSVIVSVVTIFISTYIPARRASKISAIDAIRQSQDITLTKKKVKTSRLVRKLFGFEAEIGLKNLKRNKKRYVATVFSLFISIVLFLSVAYFTETLKRTVELTQAGYNYDLEIWLYDELTDEDQVAFEAMKQLPEVTEANLLRSLWLEVSIDKSYIPESLLDEDDDHYSQIPYSMTFHVLEDELLASYAKEAGIPLTDLTNTDEVNGIMIGKMSYLDPIEGGFSEERTLKVDVGEAIDLQVYDYDIDVNHIIDVGELTVAGITEKYPVGILSLKGYASVDVLISKEVYEQLEYPESSFLGQYSFYIASDDPIKTGEVLQEIKTSNMQVINHYDDSQKEKQLSFVLAVFIYGFVALITLISVANIFNTISTSIALRKREFGMLKSVGMTPKGFNKMIRYESIFYGLKALLYGLPISIGLMYLMHWALSEGFSFPFYLPWMHIGIVIFSVFLIVSVSMMYSSAKVKKENIIDALKQENM